MLTTTRSFVAEFAAEVERDLALSPKQLQSKYLYDALGSSLFDAICRLPWYKITRSETRLLATYAPSVVAALGTSRGTIAMKLFRTRRRLKKIMRSLGEPK